MLRLDPDRVRASQRARGESESLVDDLIKADEARRNAIAHYEELRAEQKVLGKQVAQANGEVRAVLLSRTKELADMVKKAEAAQNEISIAFDPMLRQVGNLVFDDVPPGGEDDYVVVETVGRPRDFAAEGFRPKDHLELGQLLGAIDVERGAKVSGSRFYYLTGQGLSWNGLDQPGHEHRDGPRLHPLHSALAGQVAGDGRHRIPWSSRAGRLPSRGR